MSPIYIFYARYVRSFYTEMGEVSFIDTDEQEIT